MREAVCPDDGETFNPIDDDDLEHIAREDGTPCGAIGTMLGVWLPAPPQQQGRIVDLGAEDDARRAAAGLPPYHMTDDEARAAGYDD